MLVMPFSFLHGGCLVVVVLVSLQQRERCQVFRMKSDLASVGDMNMIKDKTGRVGYLWLGLGFRVNKTLFWIKRCNIWLVVLNFGPNFWIWERFRLEFSRFCPEIR
jgi:hypothetical protein